MSVAQRRGKVSENKTILVSEERDRDRMEAAIPLSLPIGNHSTGLDLNTAPVATVRRRYCGTGPFDYHWLNLDCCGLLCALFTYMLHAYAIYAVTMVLLPPWMNYDTNVAATTESKSIDNGESAATRAVVGQLLTQKQHIISWAGILHSITFTLIALLAITSHWKAMTTDPGSVPPDAQPIGIDEEGSSSTLESTNLEKGKSGDGPATDHSSTQNYLLEPPTMPKMKRICRRCKSYKPSRAHHCSICRRCIIKMDHHCPWVNNCVGIGNHKYFLLFVFYTCVSCAYSLILIVTRFAACSSAAPHYSSGVHSSRLVRHRISQTQHLFCLDRPSHLLVIIGLLLEALLFGMFTACMMIDQADVVRSKVTHIDRFTGSDIGSNALSGVVEVFGIGPSNSTSHRSVREARFRPDWLSPFVQVCFPSASLRDEVVGYCRPCLPNHPKKEKDVLLQSSFSSSLHSSSGARRKNSNLSGTSMVEII